MIAFVGKCAELARSGDCEQLMKWASAEAKSNAEWVRTIHIDDVCGIVREQLRGSFPNLRVGSFDELSAEAVRKAELRSARERTDRMVLLAVAAVLSYRGSSAIDPMKRMKSLSSQKVVPVPERVSVSTQTTSQRILAVRAMEMIGRFAFYDRNGEFCAMALKATKDEFWTDVALGKHLMRYRREGDVLFGYDLWRVRDLISKNKCGEALHAIDNPTTLKDGPSTPSDAENIKAVFTQPSRQRVHSAHSAIAHLKWPHAFGRSSKWVLEQTVAAYLRGAPDGDLRARTENFLKYHLGGERVQRPIDDFSTKTPFMMALPTGTTARNLYLSKRM